MIIGNPSNKGACFQLFGDSCKMRCFVKLISSSSEFLNGTKIYGYFIDIGRLEKCFSTKSRIL
ncbi:hypothetical protein D3C87_1341830 [compost metagenome]